MDAIRCPSVHGALVWFCFSLHCAAAASRILVFGGNGFLGATFVQDLLSRRPAPEVILLNRGGKHWDSDRLTAASTQVTCDRNNITVCGGLPGTYDYVVDFSADGPDQVSATLELLAGRVGLYLLVSTGAVYIPSAPALLSPLREEDALLLPHSSWSRGLRRRVLEGVDGYARRKLAVEDALFRFADRVNVSVVRLPYVVGERDSTHRLAMYHLWLRLAKPVLPWFAADAPLSFIGARAASSALHFLAERAPRALVSGRAFNAAFPPVTLGQVLSIVSAQVSGEAAAAVPSRPLGSPVAYVYDAVRFAGLFRFVLDDGRLRGLGWRPPAEEPDAVAALHTASRFVEKTFFAAEKGASWFPEERARLARKFVDTVGGAEKFAAKQLVLSKAFLPEADFGELDADNPPAETFDQTHTRLLWLLLSVSAVLPLATLALLLLLVFGRTRLPRVATGLILAGGLAGIALRQSAASDTSGLGLPFSATVDMVVLASGLLAGPFGVLCLEGVRSRFAAMAVLLLGVVTGPLPAVLGLTVWESPVVVVKEFCVVVHIAVFGMRETPWDATACRLFAAVDNVLKISVYTGSFLWMLYWRLRTGGSQRFPRPEGRFAETVLASMKLTLAGFLQHKLTLRRLFGEEGLGGPKRPAIESTFPVILFSHEAFCNSLTAFASCMLLTSVVLSVFLARQYLMHEVALGRRRAWFALLGTTLWMVTNGIFETHHVDYDSKAATEAAGWASVFVTSFLLVELPLSVAFLALHARSPRDEPAKNA